MISSTHPEKSISFYFFQPSFLSGPQRHLLFACIPELLHYGLLPCNKPDREDSETVTNEKEDEEEKVIEAHF